MKTIQLSTRVTAEDAQFLSELVIEGAATPSDKLRALISEERRRREELGEYGGSLRQIRNLLSPVIERILKVESDRLPHSELVVPLAQWLTETLAFLLSHVPDDNLVDERCRAQAAALEAGLADRTFQLIAKVLRLGVTDRAQCYDERAIVRRIAPVVEIVGVISKVRNESDERARYESSRRATKGRKDG